MRTKINEVPKTLKRILNFAKEKKFNYYSDYIDTFLTSSNSSLEAFG